MWPAKRLDLRHRGIFTFETLQRRASREVSDIQLHTENANVFVIYDRAGCVSVATSAERSRLDFEVVYAQMSAVANYRLGIRRNTISLADLDPVGTKAGSLPGRLEVVPRTKGRDGYCLLAQYVAVAICLAAAAAGAGIVGRSAP